MFNLMLMQVSKSSFVAQINIIYIIYLLILSSPCWFKKNSRVEFSLVNSDI